MSKKKKYISIHDVPKENPFKVPDGYFESFENRLASRIREDSEKKTDSPKKISLWNSVRPHLALAASIILFAMVSYSIIRLLVKPQEKISTEAYAQVLNYNIEDIDDETLMETYSEVQSEASVKTDEDEEYIEAVVDYLANEDIDLELIAQELNNKTP